MACYLCMHTLIYIIIHICILSWTLFRNHATLLEILLVTLDTLLTCSNTNNLSKDTESVNQSSIRQNSGLIHKYYFRKYVLMVSIILFLYLVMVVFVVGFVVVLLLQGVHSLYTLYTTYYILYTQKLYIILMIQPPDVFLRLPRKENCALGLYYGNFIQQNNLSRHVPDTCCGRGKCLYS